MIKKHFVTFGEAVQILETSKEALRQSIEFELWKTLPLLVHERSGGWLVSINGPNVKSSAADIHNAASYTVELPGDRTLRPWEWHDLDDKFCDVDDSDLSQSETGLPATFVAKGYFRLLPSSARVAAQDGRISGHDRIAPISWWNDERIPKDYRNSPGVWFTLIPNNYVRFAETSREIDEFFFMHDDIQALNRARIADESGAAPVREKALDTRERNNLLRIIAALSKEAKIPIADGRGGASAIEAALLASGFDSPKERTIREVLKQVRELD